MSEQNILNPASTSLLNPDYGYSEGLPEMRSLFYAASGKTFTRQHFARGRTYDLAWNRRDKATMHALRQWARQYENDFFTLADWERSRYFSGRFQDPLVFNPAGNEQWTIKGVFEELTGLAMYTYPTDWTRDAAFLEERNGFGEDLVKLTGTWTYYSESGGRIHGGAMYWSQTTNDFIEWLYFGYGFRLWAPKESAGGIGEVIVTRPRDGVQVLAPTNIDFYDAGAPPSAALLTKSDLGLDLYRVKLRVTGTKNGSSGGYRVFADAIEVMQ